MKNEIDLKLGGVFTFEHIRDGKVIDIWEEPNLVVDEGLTYVLDSSFSAGSGITQWWIGIYSGTYTPSASDDASNITSRSTEITTQYDETTRVEWLEAGVSAKSITNSASVAVFTFNTGVTVKGAFLASASAKSATSGTLAASSNFSADRIMIATDVLNVTYTLTVAAA